MSIIAFFANTKHYLDVDSTFFERYGRQMDLKTTFCAYKNHVNVVLTPIQRHLNVMDVETTLSAYWVIIMDWINQQQNNKRKSTELKSQVILVIKSLKIHVFFYTNMVYKNIQAEIWLVV